MNIYEIIAESARLVIKNAKVVDGLVRSDSFATFLLVFLGVVSVIAALILGFIILGEVIDAMRKRRDRFDHDYRLGVDLQPIVHEGSARRMKRVERGWRAGLAYAAMRDRNNAAFAAKADAVRRRLSTGDVGGALAIVDAPRSPEPLKSGD